MIDLHMTPIKVFCSYAPEDGEWFEKLKKHLSPLIDQGLITIWHNLDMLPGSNYIDAINTHLENSSIILLLISHHFLASNYYHSIEMQKALQRSENNQTRVIPIFLHPAHWQGSPFAHLRGLPANAKPISLWNNENEAFSYVVQGIRDVINELRTSERIKHNDTSKKIVTHSPQPSYPSPRTIFPFNENLPAATELYGRTRESRTLLDGIRKKATISIVGPRRIGKTWLMRYLEFVQDKELGAQFMLGYLDATTPQCSTVAGFTAKVMEALKIQKRFPIDANYPLISLEQAIQALNAESKIPVLCIDEFEFFGSRPIFDTHFFTSLRAIANIGLSLIIASKIPVIKAVNSYTQTSPFFNIIEQLRLGPLRIKEVEYFIQSKGDKVGLTTQERQYLLHYGQKDGTYWPVRLQLVGKLLLEDKEAAQQDQDQDYYRPEDLQYWQEFETRLEEKWRAIYL